MVERDPDPDVPPKGTGADDVPPLDFSGDVVAAEVTPSPTSDYDPREDREKARRNVAYALIGLLGIEAVGGIVALAVGVEIDAIRSLLDVVFAPTATLAGTVTAFYFAVERDRR